MTLKPYASRAFRDEDEILTFEEWCALNKISHRTGSRVLAGPDGPIVTLLSAKRIGITLAATTRSGNVRGSGAHEHDSSRTLHRDQDC